MNNKFSKIALTALLSLSILTTTGCERVEPNYAGVLMENYGKNGKADFDYQKGRVNTLMPGTKLYQVPLWEQRGSIEPLSLRSADSSYISVSPTYSYKVIEDRAIDVVFNNKQISNNGEDFLNSVESNVLNPRLIDILRKASREYNTTELMNEGGSLRFEKHVEKLVREEFEKRGLALLSFTTQFKPSEAVSKRIDARNEVNTNLAVVEQQVAEEKAKLELEKVRAEKNKIVSEGITEALLRQQFIDKWDGSTPLYGDSVSLMISPDSNK